MRSGIEKLILSWNNWVFKRSVFILCLVPILAVLSLYYTANNLGMNTDTRDMLSPELSWRKLDLEYETLFPHTTGNLILVIEAATTDEAMDSALRLEQRLKENKELFKTIFYFNNEEFIRESSLLYLDENELQDLSDRLASNQAFLARLIQDQTLNGLVEMLNEAITAKQDGEDIDLLPIYRELQPAFLAMTENKHHVLSWHNLLMAEAKKKPVYREFIIVQPKLDYSELLPAEGILNTIRNWANEIGIAPEFNQRLRMTGGVALSHEELETVSQANIQAIIIAFILVALVMSIGLGSPKLIVSILVSLLVGLLFTAAFATATIGELNLISVAFAVLYIGLGVDFAIHYCLRYRELSLQGVEKKMALATTSSHIGSSLCLCAFTTAIGFYAFVPTDYDGVAELGWISGSGMFISLIVTMSFLPALLNCLNIQFKARDDSHKTGLLQQFFRFPEKHAYSIRILAVLITVVSLWFAKDIHFDNNTLNLQPPKNESVKTYKDLLKESDTSPLSNVVVSHGYEEAIELEKKLSALSLVKEVLWLDKFIPEQQENKLFIIDEMNLLLGNLFSNEGKKEHSQESKIEELKNLQAKLVQDNAPEADAFRESLSNFLQYLKSLPKKNKVSTIEKLESNLLSTLPGRLKSLQDALQTEGLNLDDLSLNFTARWKNNERYLLDIIPKENLEDNKKLEAYVSQTQSVVPEVTGSPVVSVEAGRAVVNAFKQAFLYAVIAISVLLLILMPKKIDSAYVLVPLLLAALMTAAISVFLNIPLNFANIIALPLLLGIGVDSAIHIIHRHHHKEKNEPLLATSSARGILVSALTTILSIGNLAFSPHVGTASMGKLLTIGIIMALICTLVLIPSLLSRTEE